MAACPRYIVDHIRNTVAIVLVAVVIDIAEVLLEVAVIVVVVVAVVVEVVVVMVMVVSVVSCCLLVSRGTTSAHCWTVHAFAARGCAPRGRPRASGAV